VNIASAQNSLKKYPDAINSCEKAFKIDNKFQFAFEQKIRALIGLEKYPDAIIWLEKSLNLPDCETRNTIKRLIKLNRRMGDIDKQKEYEKKLKELDEGT
jgi:Tfp pilus assembly protein PilF